MVSMRGRGEENRRVKSRVVELNARRVSSIQMASFSNTIESANNAAMR